MARYVANFPAAFVGEISTPLKHKAGRSYGFYSLPFIFDSNVTTQCPYWHVAPTGGRRGGEAVGEAMALAYLKLLREKPEHADPEELALIAESMMVRFEQEGGAAMASLCADDGCSQGYRSFAGQFTGFFMTLATWLQAAAVQLGTELDMVTERDLLRRANDGLGFDESAYIASGDERPWKPVNVLIPEPVTVPAVAPLPPVSGGPHVARPAAPATVEEDDGEEHLDAPNAPAAASGKVRTPAQLAYIARNAGMLREVQSLMARMTEEQRAELVEQARAIAGAANTQDEAPRGKRMGEFVSGIRDAISQPPSAPRVLPPWGGRWADRMAGCWYSMGMDALSRMDAEYARLAVKELVKLETMDAIQAALDLVSRAAVFAEASRVAGPSLAIDRGEGEPARIVFPDQAHFDLYTYWDREATGQFRRDREHEVYRLSIALGYPANGLEALATRYRRMVDEGAGNPSLNGPSDAVDYFAPEYHCCTRQRAEVIPFPRRSVPTPVVGCQPPVA